MIRLIKHTEIRLANNVIRLSLGGVIWYKRVRGELFKQKVAEYAGADTYVSAIHTVLDFIGEISSLDIILGEHMYDLVLAQKTFGSGWCISDTNGSVEVSINCLFTAHALTLRADTNLICDAASILRSYGIEHGRLFCACPGQDFRYSVFTQLFNVFEPSDVVGATVVHYCASLPRFSDGDVSNQVSQSLANYSENLSAQPTLGPSQNEIVGVPLSVDLMPIIRKELPVSSMNENTKHVTLYILLDNTVETAMAAGIYLADDMFRDPIISEIGLWRKKLKSVFHKYSSDMSIFEFLHLPLSEQDLRDLQIFLRSMMKSSSNTPLVLVIGEEMLKQEVANQLISVLDFLLPYDVCIFGQSGRLLDKKMPSLIQFIEKANHCIIKIANCEDALSTLRETINDVAVDLYTLPFSVKQKLLIAEKNNTLRDRLKEVRYLVFPREGDQGAGNRLDGEAAAVIRPTLPVNRAS